MAIARALAYDSKTILGDEPTGNLDKETETEILDIFTNLAHEDNKCVIIISHSSSVKEKVDVVLNLKEGHVLILLGRVNYDFFSFIFCCII